MKQGKRLTALTLAIVMLLGMTIRAGAMELSREIEAQLSYDIRIMYNGKLQTLRDAAGNTVYPLSYQGATYLPIRAVCGMLGLQVDWDGGARTVLLSGGGTPAGASPVMPAAGSGEQTVRATEDPGITVRYNGEVQTLRDAAGNTVCPLSYQGTTFLPARAVCGLADVQVDWEEDTRTVLLRAPQSGGRGDVFKDFTTSTDAGILGEDHIGCGWGEIDWSDAEDSYARVTVRRLPGPSAQVVCRAYWSEDGRRRSGLAYALTEGEWIIPLPGGSTEYAVDAALEFTACEHYRTDEENAAAEEWPQRLRARFDAEVTDPDHRWLLSTPTVDFAHAPLTCEKAREITRDCGTDAEKIAAVFRWVFRNIRYDHEEANRLIAPARPGGDAEEEAETAWMPPCEEDPVNGRHTVPPGEEELERRAYTDQQQLSLDLILTRGTGVCAHYAALMTGMLRSLGVPCKFVGGKAYSGKIIKGFSPDGWGGHAWVAVNPGSGDLDRRALGAGTEEDGWIRLDPTNAHNRQFTAKDSNYRASEWY